MNVARRAELRGVVQGVGFRPFVVRLARALELGGSVVNRGGVVAIDVQGPAAALDRFAKLLVDEAPAAARIDSIVWTDIAAIGHPRPFEIAASEAQQDHKLAIGPDLRVCDACLAEITNVQDRRFGYALNGCTACGPRFSMATHSPWQRERSSMAGFMPCPTCAREFADPNDRRFHAETICCPTCGPQLRLEDRDGRTLADPTHAIPAAVDMLRRGGILALQGIGGFQLLVDARDQAAVLRLRERKRRPSKPLALMVADLDAAERLAWLEPGEREALAGRAGPIVLVRRRCDTDIAEAVAPARPTLGLMLATTPAHALLLARFGAPLVATSGNIHERPIALTHADARSQLGDVADALLVHDRPIQRRCDDAVTQFVAGQLRTLRLGRGQAPARFELPPTFAELPPMLALGAQLAHAPVLMQGGSAIAWPHVGDLDEPHTRAAMHESIADLEHMLGCREPLLAIDAHPDTATSNWARTQAEQRCILVFHHHAHVASVLAEHGRERALGVAWDGTGLGPDHTIWGGEFLEVDPRGARRVAHLRPFPLPGGDAAARDGLRSLAGMLAVSQLDAATDPELDRLITLARKPRLAPQTTSVGRMFDAVAALTGVCRHSRHQAEAAQALEHAATPGAAPYPFHVHDGVIDWRPMLAAMLAQRDCADLVASRFHATLIAMIVQLATTTRAPTVVLAGGCFANRLLLDGAIEALRARGIEALAACRLPPGDGGLALGQVWVAGHRLRQEQPRCASRSPAD